MSVQRKRVWMVPGEGDPAPIGKTNAGQYALIIALCVVLIGFGITIPSAGNKVLYFSGAGAFIYILILVTYVDMRVQQGTVSIVQKRGSLRFALSWLGQLIRYGGMVVAALTTTMLAFLSIGIAFVRGSFSLRAVIFSVLALVFWGCVVWVLARLTKPRGLVLSDVGVAEAWTMIAWDSISGIDVVRKKMPDVIVRSNDGKKVRVAGAMTGSDVNVIAIVLRHYLDHPEERWMLTDPEKALMRVYSVGRCAELLRPVPRLLHLAPGVFWASLSCLARSR